jgi:hypothetical protein
MAHPKQISPQQPVSPPDSRPPEQVIYSAFFHYVVDMKNDATDLDNAGKSGDSLRTYVQLRARLNSEEARLLDVIASSCVQQVSQQDQEALAVIEKFRAQFPGGKVPKGTKLPPPPPELKAMQQQRDTIVIGARDRLRAALGGVGFNKVSTFIEKYISPNTRRVQPVR